MERKQFETETFVLYAPDSLKYITDNLEETLNQKVKFYKELFDISSFRKIQINYFDDIEKFREYIYSLNDDKEPLPEYATGTFDGGMINAFIEPNIIVGTQLYYKKLYMAVHELFHIMYKELVWSKNCEDRIIWFDEGMAQLFSGEKDNILDDEHFNVWVRGVVENTKEIPDLNQLNHGSSFENEKYSGYKLSLLAVKYLFDSLGIDEFRLLMYDTKRIKSYGDIVVKEAIDYYKGKNKVKF